MPRPQATRARPVTHEVDPQPHLLMAQSGLHRLGRMSVSKSKGSEARTSLRGAICKAAERPDRARNHLSAHRNPGAW